MASYIRLLALSADGPVIGNGNLRDAQVGYFGSVTAAPGMLDSTLA